MLLSMDIGNHTAICVWENNIPIAKPTTISLPKQENSKEQNHKIMLTNVEHFLKTQIDIFKVTKVFIEGVGLWGHSARSQTAAKQGHTFWVAYLVGGYMELFRQLNPAIEIELVNVLHWRGNLPLTVIKNRLKAKYPALTEKMNEHEVCSVGIGHFGISQSHI